MEVYAGSHFVTLTGDVGQRSRIEDRTTQFAELAADLQGRRLKLQRSRWAATATSSGLASDFDFSPGLLSDGQVVEKVRQDPKGEPVVERRGQERTGLRPDGQDPLVLRRRGSDRACLPVVATGRPHQARAISQGRPAVRAKERGEAGRPVDGRLLQPQ